MAKPKNLAAEIERMAGTETIIGVVIGEDIMDAGEVPQEMCNRLLTWEQARPVLDYEWLADYGGRPAPALYAWTETRIIRTHEYDTVRYLGVCPRNPMDCVPKYD